MSTPGGYHDKCGERSLGKQLNLYGNPSVLNTPTVLMISSQCTEHPPMYSMIFPSVLNIPRCTAQTLCRVVMAERRPDY